MTEAEWLHGADVRRMLHFACANRATARKFRLFAVACCRLIQDAVRDPTSRNAIDIAERLAEGLVSEQERDAAYRSARKVALNASREVGKIGSAPENAATFCVEPTGIFAAKRVHNWLHSAALITAVSRNQIPGPDAHQQMEFLNEVAKQPEVMKLVADILALEIPLLLDIFGNPFRPPPPIDPSLLTPAIVALAGDIYQQRAFERLPELAAALEAHGCRDAELLGHLRGPGPHVRGCWALDLVLGKL